MCEMLAKKLSEGGVEFEKETRREILIRDGVTHVPMLRIEDGRLLTLAQSLKYVKGEKYDC